MNNSDIEIFIQESNAIEGVYDLQSFKDSLQAWEFLNKQDKNGINPFIVMQVHELIMKNVGAWSEPKLLPKYRGVLRDCPVYIGCHEAMNPKSLDIALEEWCNNMNKKHIGGDMAMTKFHHIQYEGIHPFVDGNGRTGRMFMNWWRLRNNLPLLIIHKGKEQMEYYKWFK